MVNLMKTNPYLTMNQPDSEEGAQDNVDSMFIGDDHNMNESEDDEINPRQNEEITVEDVNEEDENEENIEVVLEESSTANALDSEGDSEEAKSEERQAPEEYVSVTRQGTRYRDAVQFLMKQEQKKREQRHMDYMKTAVDTMFEQMPASKGIQIFKERAVAAMVKELTQLDKGAVDGKPVVVTINPDCFTEDKKRRALAAVNLIKQKEMVLLRVGHALMGVNSICF